MTLPSKETLAAANEIGVYLEDRGYGFLGDTFIDHAALIIGKHLNPLRSMAAWYEIEAIIRRREPLTYDQAIDKVVDILRRMGRTVSDANANR